jgi:signal transduction histidine kinase
VLVNLLSNVVKYAPGCPVKVQVRRRNEQIVLSVRDYGPGIPRDKIHMIFERFERAEASRNISGLGLGLFICRQIVAGHGGEIWVESDGKTGSNFIMRLPLVPPGQTLESRPALPAGEWRHV